MLSSLSEDSGIIIFSSSNEWGTNPPPVTQPNRRSKKQVINPIFEEYKKMTRDLFWMDFFDKAKVNTFPKNFSFNEDTITHRIRNKYTSFKLAKPEDNSLEANCEIFDKLKIFLFSTGGIESPTDAAIRSKKTFTLRVEELPFRKIKSVPAKLKIALSNYTSLMSKKYNLSLGDISILEGVIRIAIVAGHIDEDDVILRHNLIEEIKNVTFNEKERTISITYNNTKQNKKNVDTEEYSRLTYSLGSSNSSNNDSVIFLPKKSIIEQWESFIEKICEKKSSFAPKNS